MNYFIFQHSIGEEGVRVILFLRNPELLDFLIKVKNKKIHHKLYQILYIYEFIRYILK